MSEQHQNLIRTIEKQRARIEALEAALREIAELANSDDGISAFAADDIASAALTPEQDK